MAKFLHSILSPTDILFFFYLFFFFTAEAAAAAQDPEASFLQSQKTWSRPVREKMSHLRFYWHDIYSGSKPTAVMVAAAASSNASSTGFGEVTVIDDPLTVSPKLSSRLVGRAQGLYASTGQEELALLVAMNFAFVERRFNGSSIAILGRNAVVSGVREMSVVGGSGVFRLARGYAQAKTYSFDLMTGDAVVEYNVFVTHY